MPAAAGCTNCYTKYSLFTKEYGCPKCHLSFCKKCLSKKAIISGKTTVAVPVCPDCYGKLTQPIAPPRTQHFRNVGPPPYSTQAGMSSSVNNGALSQNWWGEGLPPPSMRIQTNPDPLRCISSQNKSHTEQQKNDAATKDLEGRLQILRHDDDSAQTGQACSLSDIETRLAALRGCDVELIRKPRMWFTSATDESMDCDTVDSLMKVAEDRARIEIREDEQLEERYCRFKGSKENETSSYKLDNQMVGSDETQEIDTYDTASQNTMFSEATKEELLQIKELMSVAEKRLLQAKQSDLNSEMKSVLAETRQQSLELEKINEEIDSFYARQMPNVKLEEDGDNISDTSVDGETLRKILLEADEIKEEYEKEIGKKEVRADGNSPKKGFFGKLFKK